MIYSAWVDLLNELYANYNYLMSADKYNHLLHTPEPLYLNIIKKSTEEMLTNPQIKWIFQADNTVKTAILNSNLINKIHTLDFVALTQPYLEQTCIHLHKDLDIKQYFKLDKIITLEDALIQLLPHLTTDIFLRKKSRYTGLTLENRLYLAFLKEMKIRPNLSEEINIVRQFQSKNVDDSITSNLLKKRKRGHG